MKCNTCQNDRECYATLYLYGGVHYILGQYGSKKYDMQRYALKHGLLYDTGDICDNCINNLINAGKANLIEDGVW